MKIAKPTPGTYPEYMETYISKVNGDNLLEELLTEHYETIDLITSIDLETQHYRYAPGKWNIKEIIQHLMDSERIFANRMLRIARNDKTPMPGFEENDYALASNATQRNMNDIAREFSVIRASTIELIKSLDEAWYDNIGLANGKQISVRALMFVIPGHEMHHRRVIEERYLPK